MVWRSLMEKVEPKDIIRNKGLQVFNDDMKKLQKQNIFEVCSMYYHEQCNGLSHIDNQIEN